MSNKRRRNQIINENNPNKSEFNLKIGDSLELHHRRQFICVTYIQNVEMVSIIMSTVVGFEECFMKIEDAKNRRANLISITPNYPYCPEHQL